jgi:uncharacterized membrane protein
METVVVLGFRGIPQARDALPALRRLHDAGEIDLGAAAVVGRRVDGRSFALEQTTDAGAPSDAVEGLLTGPFGVVLEHAPDALVGSLVDVADSRRADQLVHSFGDAVPPGAVVAVALVTERTPEAVDALASRLTASLTKKSRADVEQDIAAIEAQRRRGIGERLRGIKDALLGSRGVQTIG